MYTRHCGTCNKEIKFKTKHIVEKNKNKDCSSCSAKKRGTGKNYEYWVKKYGVEEAEKRKERVRLENSIKNSGPNNAMYGKTVKDIWIEKYGVEEAERKCIENANKMGRSGPLNAMHGKTVKGFWVEKHGVEEAERKWDDHKKKIGRSGPLNAQYGKPAPKGAGNGWSGYYMGYYFRSILELSYLKYLIDNEIKFENAECSKHRMSLSNGKSYFCDYYLVEDEIYIEIKPKALTETDINQLKFKTAKDKHGEKFKVLSEEDLTILNTKDMVEMYDNGSLTFLDRFDKKFKERYYNET